MAREKMDAMERIARIVSPRTTRPMGQDDWIRMRQRVRLAVWRILRERAEAAVIAGQHEPHSQNEDQPVYCRCRAVDIRAAVLGRPARRKVK